MKLEKHSREHMNREIANVGPCTISECYARRNPSLNLHPRLTTMPTDDYTPITRGSLKLKGVKDSKIDKKKKKKKKTEDSDSISKSAEVVASDKDGEDALGAEGSAEKPPTTHTGAGKTEAERRHEEMRRKRVRCAPSSVEMS
jgi:protein FAM32A